MMIYTKLISDRQIKTMLMLLCWSSHLIRSEAALLLLFLRVALYHPLLWMKHVNTWVAAHPVTNRSYSTDTPSHSFRFPCSFLSQIRRLLLQTLHFTVDFAVLIQGSNSVFLHYVTTISLELTLLLQFPPAVVLFHGWDLTRRPSRRGVTPSPLRSCSTIPQEQIWHLDNWVIHSYIFLNFGGKAKSV